MRGDLGPRVIEDGRADLRDDADPPDVVWAHRLVLAMLNDDPDAYAATLAEFITCAGCSHRVITAPKNGHDDGLPRDLAGEWEAALDELWTGAGLPLPQENAK